MKAFILLCSLMALGSCQPLFQPLYEDLTEKPVWQGPLADHVIGVHPAETAEVAAARARHLNAHARALAVLPTLPPEIRYQQHGILLPQQHTVIPSIPHVPQPVPVVPVANPPIHTSPQFTQFAEEIPRSDLGEVPEVHAARVAHLQAHKQARLILPPF